MTPEKFRETRRGLRLTQAMLADRLGVTTHTIKNIESGRVSLRPIYVNAISSVASKVAREMADRAKALQSAD